MGPSVWALRILRFGAAAFLVYPLRTVHAFATNPMPPKAAAARSLHAKPQRLAANVDGALYVNDQCINCAACHNFAPQSFDRHQPTDRYHYVYEQPTTPTALEQARAAMTACPVAAIRLETKAERQHRSDDSSAVEEWRPEDQHVVDGVSGRTATTKPFPRRFLDSMDDVYWVGHHTEKSFGAVPYLLQTRKEGQWIMVDTPRFGKAAQASIEQLTGRDGPDYLVLTHVDDTADHQRWAEHYPTMQRIFHAHDLGPNNWLGDTSLEDVEILLGTDEDQVRDLAATASLTMYDLKGQRMDAADVDQHEVILLHTPGHSPGSITLWRRSSDDNDDDKPGILFTGDTYAWTTRNGGRMTGFGRYGNDLRLQSKVLGALSELQSDGWSVVAPGHGIPRDYRGLDPAVPSEELAVAQDDLLALR